MAEKKGRPKLNPQQLRKLFAMGVLKVSGKGEKRKVAYEKPDKKSAGGSGPRTVADRISALRDVAAGTRSAGSLPERVGRYRERAQSAEAAALKKLQERAKQRMGEDYYGPARKQRIEAATARLERVRSLKRSIQQANVPEDASAAVRQSGAGLAQRTAKAASQAAQTADIKAAATAAKQKRDNPASRITRVNALLSQLKQQQRDLYGPTDIRTNKRRKERYAQLKKRERALERIREGLPVLGYGGM